ncbi:MAG: hypothetical protein CMQ40_04505 [Gammaproteobacteria bacterium]|nr:hypothetical protein [Gammaproteobacteria bacterium]
MQEMKFSTKALLVAATVFILVFISGPLGYRFLGVALQPSLVSVIVAVIGGLVLSFFSAYYIFQNSRMGLSWDRKICLLSMIVSLLPTIVMAPQILSAVSVPPIHDISTDTENPPEFVVAKSFRESFPNSSEYGDEAWPPEKLASATLTAYPEIKSIVSNLNLVDSLKKSGEVLVSMGMEIISMDASYGRIEAVDTSFWFGFKDDLVLRIKEQDNGVIVDVRSKSRVGQSDLGVNAARIKEFTEKFSSPN